MLYLFNMIGCDVLSIFLYSNSNPLFFTVQYMTNRLLYSASHIHLYSHLYIHLQLYTNIFSSFFSYTSILNHSTHTHTHTHTQSDKEMVEMLLNASADPTLLNAKNETAYTLAVQSGRKVVAMILAEADGE